MIVDSCKKDGRGFNCAEKSEAGFMLAGGQRFATGKPIAKPLLHDGAFVAPTLSALRGVETFRARARVGR